MARIDPSLVVRLPADLKERLRQQAQDERRTLTGQVIHMLETALPPESTKQGNAA
ncbi:ribbon-helix-helix domain-containing protein [Devosia sp. RR2S18]|uniref:ribbon-helix-helix domain-containing protein n=1 Tax=Devosia rhizosphaerae TaxID=3049774 RepID=UPI0025417286|nr:Arc family DNA-binding protein [Devosia sp. RR2S18]WIJ26618.1 Arc family DNA-binding protein [Devosia sp. RR2S18]